MENYNYSEATKVLLRQQLTNEINITIRANLKRRGRYVIDENNAVIVDPLIAKHEMKLRPTTFE